MCGRYALHADPDVVALQFGLDSVPEFKPSYNIAPASEVLVVKDAAALARWGMRGRFVNLRAETVLAKFRSSGRCLVPASGFYEWRRAEKSRQPYLLRRRDGKLMALAGLWDRWRPAPGDPRHAEAIESCTILTTPANELVARLHDRMPLVLDPVDYDLWLDPAVRDPERLAALLRPFPAEEMVAIPVSPRVNSPDNDDPALLEPVEPAPLPEPRQRTLF
jgi:putative SOS response-associated peptidase YedK